MQQAIARASAATFEIGHEIIKPSKEQPFQNVNNNQTFLKWD